MISIVIVEPEHEGNIGSIARLMKNFGLKELWLVNPKIQIGKEAFSLASHANDVLENAKIVNDLDTALSNVGSIIGTTSIYAKSSTNLLRANVSPQELAKTIYTVKGKVAILFGRESTGLSNEELTKCDILVTIPTSPYYRTLNVASASAIIFYELWKTKSKFKRGFVEEASREHRERLQSYFEKICQLSPPSHKARLASKAFKNLTSRGFISRREATLMLGVFRQLLQESPKKIE